MIDFSVVIPVYNKEEQVRNCIESVLAQDYDSFEIIIVNDGSKDCSLDVIRLINSSRIKVIDKQNGGVSSARNVGISESSGMWVTFLDADDMMYVDALSTYMALIDKYSKHLVFAAATDQSNKKYPSTNKEYIVNDYDYFDALSYARNGFSLVNSDCICINKKCFHQVGYFNENYTHGEDMDLWKRISDFFEFVKIEKAVAFYEQEVLNSSSAVRESNRKYAPIAILERPRSCFKTFSSRLLQGSKAFFFILPMGIRKCPMKSLKILFRYFDWIILFCIYLFLQRLIKK